MPTQRMTLPNPIIAALVLVAGLAAAAVDAHSDALFGGAFLEFDAGSHAWCVAVGDINGDGRPDLAVANNDNPGTVSTLLGNGDGTFQTKVDQAPGFFAVSVALADLSGDGHLDLVVGYSGMVSVLLGDGHGSFGSRTDYSISGVPYGLAIRDLNGDGKLDVVATNDSASVSVYLGDGVGGLGTRTDLATGPAPRSVLVADVNGDGKLDVVTANASGPWCCSATATEASLPNTTSPRASCRTPWR